MERRNKTLWKLLPPSVRTKVARSWGNREGTAEYLRTLATRHTLQQAASQVDGSAQWADLGGDSDVDLARVYAVAAQCVTFDTYKAFAAALDQVTVRQLAARLPGDTPCPPPDLHRARCLVLRRGRG